jgi:hypothetical protein
MLEMIKFYEKKLLDNFRLDRFVKDGKVSLSKMDQTKVVKLAGG